jgi:hypothetical protein
MEPEIGVVWKKVLKNLKNKKLGQISKVSTR